jgi:hypothetical protein
VDDAEPFAFVPGLSPSRLEWILDDESKDYLGNEFLLWLWWTLENESDTIRLTDKSESPLWYRGRWHWSVRVAKRVARRLRRMLPPVCPKPVAPFSRASCRARPG